MSVCSNILCERRSKKMAAMSISDLIDALKNMSSGEIENLIDIAEDVKNNVSEKEIKAKEEALKKARENRKSFLIGVALLVLFGIFGYTKVTEDLWLIVLSLVVSLLVVYLYLYWDKHWKGIDGRTALLRGLVVAIILLTIGVLYLFDLVGNYIANDKSYVSPIIIAGVILWLSDRFTKLFALDKNRTIIFALSLVILGRFYAFDRHEVWFLATSSGIIASWWWLSTCKKALFWERVGKKQFEGLPPDWKSLQYALRKALLMIIPFVAPYIFSYFNLLTNWWEIVTAILSYLAIIYLILVVWIRKLN